MRHTASTPCRTESTYSITRYSPYLSFTHSSAPLTMPVVIDHTAYPDIINAIIAHASPPALFKLRLMSTGFRKRIDTALAEHVVVDSDGKLHLAHEMRFSPGPSKWTLHATPADVRTLDMDCRLSSRCSSDFSATFTSATMLRRLWWGAATVM